MIYNLCGMIMEKAKDGSSDINQIPSGILAYMGDSIYEIIVRNFFVQRKNWDSHKLHHQVIKFVNAGAQADIIRVISEHLTEEELAVFRRGRNSNAGNVPRNANVSDYRLSTGFEALMGYLFLKGDIERLKGIIFLIENYLDEKASED